MLYKLVQKLKNAKNFVFIFGRKNFFAKFIKIKEVYDY